MKHHVRSWKKKQSQDERECVWEWLTQSCPNLFIKWLKLFFNNQKAYFCNHPTKHENICTWPLKSVLLWKFSCKKLYTFVQEIWSFWNILQQELTPINYIFKKKEVCCLSAKILDVKIFKKQKLSWVANYKIRQGNACKQEKEPWWH